MEFFDCVQETSTTTGTGDFALSGATTGNTTFATDVTIGATVPYRISNGAEWEIGDGVLSNSTTLERTIVVKSSNSNQLVNFSAGSKTVFITAHANLLRRGLVNPDDVGYDIVLCAGQSNMCGRGVLDTSLDAIDSRVWQFGGASAATSPPRYRQIFPGIDPIHNQEGINTGLNSPQSSFGTAYVATVPTNRRILLVPVAAGGTALVTGSHEWEVGSSLALNAIVQSNLAITAAQAAYPNSRFVGIIWIQGESDQIGGVTQAAYVAALKDLIAEFRSEITDAEESWFVIGGMAPGFISSGYGTSIHLAHQQVAEETDKCWFVAGPSGKDDALHYTAAGLRILGPAMAFGVRYAEVYTAIDDTAPTVTSAAVEDATPTLVDFVFSETMDTNYLPASSTVGITNHTVTNIAWFSSTVLRVTVSVAFVNGEVRTRSYTANGTNNIRDIAGNELANFTGQAITNNVIGAATGVTMTGPSGGVEDEPSTNFSIGVTPIGGAITGTVVVTPSDGGDGGSFTPTTVSLTSGSPTATFTYTPATVGAKTISVTNNGGLSNPSNITYTATSGDVTAPSFSSAQVADAAPSDIVITFDETLGASTPATSTFAASGGKTVTGTSRSGATITVTVDTPYTSSDTITITYTAPGSNPRIQDAAGNITASFGPSSVTNNIAGDTVIRARAGFTDLTESGSSPNWIYTGTGDATFNAVGCVFDHGLAANELGSMTVEVRASPNGHTDQICFGVIAGTTLLGLGSRDFALVNGSGDGVYLVYNNGGFMTPTNSVVKAVGDWIRLRRSDIGTPTWIAEVSKNSGSSWTTINTVTAFVSAAARNFQLHIMGGSGSYGAIDTITGDNVVAN